MIGTLLERLEAIFGWIIQASWQASVLAALVLLAQWAFRARLNSRWTYLLWLLVVARLLMPALPESAFSLFRFAPEPPVTLVQTATEPIFNTVLVPMASAPSPEPQRIDYPFSLYTVLALAWLAGALVLLVVTWQVNRRFARHVQNAPAIDDEALLQIASAAQKELGVHRSMRLIESTQVQGPAIMGLFHPTLILPKNVRARFTDHELRFIFLHEFAHLKRGDLILQWLIAVLQILHWFNPILWYAFRRMRADREPATDALVLSRTGEPEAYGQVLIKLLEHYHRRHSLPTLVGILEDRNQFKRRFQLIGQFTRGAYGWSLLGLILIAILAAVCLTRSKLAPPSHATEVISATTDGNSALVRIALSAVQLGEDDYQAHRAEIDDAVRKGEIETLAKLRTFNLLSAPVALGKTGEQCTMEEVRVMPYPVKWAPAFDVKNNDGSSVHAGPTPTDFKKQNLGVRSVLKPTISGKTINLFCNFEVVTFAGWTGTLGSQVAHFNRRALDLSETFEPNVAKGFQVPGGAQMEPADPTDIDFMDKPPVKPSPKSLVRLFAFFSVSIANAKNTAAISKARADLDALYDAIRKNDREAVARLLRSGADPNRHIYQQPLLAYARDAAMMKVLLGSGANPNEEDILGTPLASAPNAECVRLLVRHGADVRHKSENGNSLIVSAIYSGRPDRGDVIQELIKQGAEFDPHGPSGAQALAAAAQRNDLSVAKVLLDHGVSPNAFCQDAYTRESSVGAAAWEPSTETLKYLIQHGANPAGDPREEESPLAMALIFGRKENEAVLRKAGAHDVCELSIASADGNIAKVRNLLDREANINEPDRLGNTPLYYACRRAQLEIARLLLSRGANPSQFNAYGMTTKASLDLMAASGNTNQYQMDWDIPEGEGKRRMAAFDELFSKYPPNPNYRDSHGRTALHQAIVYGNVELELVNKGHPIDANTPDGDGIPPLLLAARSPAAGDSSLRITTQGTDKTRQKWNSEAYIADQLIKAGAKLDLVVADGKTVAELAIEAAKKANNAQLVSVIQAAMDKGKSTSSIAPPSIPTSSLIVHVQDKRGQPIAGAKLSPHMLLGAPQDNVSYGWTPRSEDHWPQTTDAQGNAVVPFPVCTVSDLKTDQIYLVVEHPGFGPVDEGVQVGQPKPITMHAAKQLTVLVNPPSGASITQTYCQIVGSDSLATRLLKWYAGPTSDSVHTEVVPGFYVIRAVALDAAKKIYFSSFAASTSNDATMVKLDVRPGITLKGSLDATVVRPVRNGVVVSSINDEFYNGLLTPPCWYQSAPVLADGSFVLENAPAGGVNLVAVCDGYVSKSTLKPIDQPVPGVVRAQRMNKSPTESLIVAMEQTGSVRVRVLDPDGKPLAGAKVAFFPNESLT